MQPRLALAFCLVLLSACDWDQFALLNSIPVHGKSGGNKTVRVYLGLDGLSYATVSDVIAMRPEVYQGFSGGDWRRAHFVAMFPATSDASWSRILHSERMGGYEYEFYDPTQDTIVNKGYLGLVNHGIPPVEGTTFHTPTYYTAFDYYANGYLDTVWTYQTTELSFADSLDSLFFLLAQKSEFEPVFTAYIPELDVMGHMQTREMVEESFIVLWHRIAEFKRKHPERNFLFTLFSDHALDFLPASEDQLVRFDDVMRGVGITPVESFDAGRRQGGMWAVPIIHTRVSYLSLHTEAALAQSVAERVSGSPTVDLAVSLGTPNLAIDPNRRYAWTTLWRGGRELVTFGYDATTDRYFLPSGADYTALDVPVDVSGAEFVVYDDQALFELTLLRNYPDLFHRARTSLLSVSVRYPGQVLVSFKRPYASIGFEMPGNANAIASSGFHGGLEQLGSLGVVLTEERDLPVAIRSDNVLELFPALAEHMERRHMYLEAGEPGSSLNYDTIDLSEMIDQ